MQAAINEQINFEMFSANTYLSMSAYFSQQGLDGFAHWYYMQYKEELTHAEDMMRYVITRGGKVEIKAVAAVETEFNSPQKKSCEGISFSSEAMRTRPSIFSETRHSCW